MIRRFCFCLLLLTNSMCAQKKLREQDSLRFKSLADEKTKLFQKYISKLGTKKNTPENEKMKSIILKMFDSKVRVAVVNSKGLKKRYIVADYLDRVTLHDKNYKIEVLEFEVKPIYIRDNQEESGFILLFTGLTIKEID